MRILFVKLTSMGDLIHALPALTDAMRNIPGIAIDWVIDKNFAEVATWHPAVTNVFCTEHRKWRKQPLQSFSQGDIPQLVAAIRKQKYDFVIDGQTNLKSAFIMLLTRGLRCGLDKNSAREWLAHLVYQKKYAIPKDMHAIARLRILFSEILQYPLADSEPDYQIQNFAFPAPKIALPAKYLIYVHNASWQSKLWPLDYWHTLIKLAEADNLAVLLPWGNAFEKERAEQLQRRHKNAQVLPFCTLSELAWLLQHAQGAICSDTGLSHLAAALDVPAVTMYGATSSKLIGTTGKHQAHQVSPFPCISCYKHQCNYQNQVHANPPCLSAIKPEWLWEKLCSLYELRCMKGRSLHAAQRNEG
jgi:heptosyltransferase I